MTNEELLSLLGMDAEEVKERIIERAARIIADKLWGEMKTPQPYTPQPPIFPIQPMQPITVLYGCQEPYPTVTYGTQQNTTIKKDNEE